jgi:hypothetical protein
VTAPQPDDESGAGTGGPSNRRMLIGTIIAVLVIALITVLAILVINEIERISSY